MCCFWVCIRNTVYAQRGTCSWFWASLQIVDLLLDEDLDAKSRGAPLRALTTSWWRWPSFGRHFVRCSGARYARRVEGFVRSSKGRAWRYHCSNDRRELPRILRCGVNGVHGFFHIVCVA